MNYTVRRLVLHSLVLCLAIGIGLSSYIMRTIDPAIPVNKTTSTIGLILFLLWLIMPLVLGWVKVKGGDSEK